MDTLVVTQIIVHARQKKHTDVTARKLRSEGSFLLLQTFTFALELV